LPPKLADIEQVSPAKVLGVYQNDRLNMTEQLTKTVAVCNFGLPMNELINLVAN